MTFWDVFKITVGHGYILQLFFAEMLFAPVLTRRKYFFARLGVSLAVFAVVAVAVTNLINLLVPGLYSFTIFLLSFGMLAFLFKNDYKELLFAAVGAQLIQNLSHNFEMLVYLPLSGEINDLGWFFLSVGAMVAVYAGAYFIIIRRLEKRRDMSIENYGIFAIAVASALFCYLIQFLLQVYGVDKLWIVCLPLILCDLLAIILQFGLLGYKQKINENADLERIIARESEHYEAVKNNIDLINMKAHDLKHFIRDLREGGYADDGLEDIQSAVERYEKTANTGNAALDVVLTEKSYVCQKSGISLATMVQGEELAFMRTSDVTTVFGNILSNAIEYEESVAEAEKRCILLKVFRRGAIVCIHADNYCTAQLKFKDGLPVSTKGDDDYHGFGLKSVKYVAEKYGGNFTAGRSGDLFAVDIIIPVPEKKV